MKVAIVGSRNIGKFGLDDLGPEIPEDCSLIISGGARGIDQLAEKYAWSHEIPFRKFLPDYEKHGSRAPIIRNTEMVEYSDQVIAFWDFESRGTAFTIAECVRLGVPVRIIPLANEKNTQLAFR